jgi:tetratricopeptide (TPR) repeat protein
LLDRQLEINRHTGNIEGEVVGLSNLGYTYILIGLPEDGIPSLRSCIEKARSIGHRSFSAYGGLNLALAFIRNGDPESALNELVPHIQELELMNDLFGYATGQTYKALAMESSGDVSGALARYEQSARIFAEIGIDGPAKDAEAGIIRCLLIRNQLEDAEKYARSLLDYLKDKNGAGMEFPILGYETCINAFTLCGHPAIAREILGHGYSEMMRRAEKISSQKWRQSFLELVPENRNILEEWQKISIQDWKESAQ